MGAPQFDPQLDEFLRDGLHAAAEDTPPAPGLFEAVAQRAHRRTVRTRVLSSAAAVCAVAGIALGATATLSSTAHEIEATPRPGPPVSCPTNSWGAEPTGGPADHLLTGRPTSATLCHYGLSGSGTGMSVEAIPLGGATLEELVAQLADSKAPSACPADSIAPTQILIVQAEGQPLQRLVIDFSGCGTVSNGKRSVLIPQMLKDLLGWTGKH